MAHKYDQTADLNLVELSRYTKLYDPPAYVKTADLQDTCRPAGLPLNVYADIRQPPQLPCHTKAATYVSWAYFLNHRSEINPKVVEKIAQRLESFAASHGILPTVERLLAKHAALQTDDLGQLPDSAFAYVWVDELGGRERRYPLRNALEVKAAAGWFAEHRDHFGYADRQTMASKILTKAASFGADIRSERQLLERQAGYGFCHPAQAAELIRKRAAASIAPRELREQLLKVATATADTSEVALESAHLQKLAAMLDQFDHLPGNQYLEPQTRLEDVLFGVTYTEAAQFKKVACTLTTGSVYTQAQFAKLALRDVRDVFGSELAEQVSVGLHVDPEKMAEVAFTLPRPHALQLEQLLDEAGVQPVTKQAIVADAGFTSRELQQLAQ